MEKHHKKLSRISGYSENDLNFLKRILLKKIEIIDLESIAPSTWEKAIELVKDVDEFDAFRSQSFLDYLRYEELTSKSKDPQKDLDLLLKEVKKGRLDKIKRETGLDG